MRKYLQDVALTLSTISQSDLDEIGVLLLRTYHQGGTIYVCGNGGSAATASHLACDLMKWTIVKNSPRLRSIALTDNVPLITAWSNDEGYEYLFQQQLASLYRPGDMLFAISGSGNSPNIIHVVEWAINHHMAVAGLSGFDGGELSRLSTHSIVVDNHTMPQIEDIHSVICHALAVWMKDALLAQWTEQLPSKQ